jgi:hypothetical protein
MGLIAMLLGNETLEIHYRKHILGIFERADLRAWLLSPTQPLSLSA